MTETRGEQRPEPLAREALDLFEEYQRTGDQSLLTRAIPVFRAALAAATRTGAPNVAAYHNNLAYALHSLADATADATAQAEPVSHQRAAVAATDPDNLDRVPYLFTLASGLRDLYGRTRRVELLHDAVQAATEAIGLHGFEPVLTTQYSILAGALGDLYDSDPDPVVLNRIIAAYREAASYAELLDDPDAATQWSSLGGWLRERHALTGDVGVLTEAALFARKAVAAASGDKRLTYLSNLGDTLRLRFERTGDLDALTEAVGVTAALAGTWPGHPDLPRRASNLAGTLLCRYDRTGDITGLAESITAARRAVAAAPPGYTERGGYLANLQLALEREWQRTGTSPCCESASTWPGRRSRPPLQSTARGHSA